MDGNPAHNSKRTQVWLKKNLTGVVGEGYPASQLPLTVTLLTILQEASLN
jgi:hypothetical protein